MEMKERKDAAARLSVVSNTALVVLKLSVGLLIGSVSVVSEAIHSGVDLLAAVIALLAVKASGRPPDEEHPYGHGKVENISGTIEALLIFAAAGWIIFEAVRKLQHLKPMEAAGWGVVAMLLSTLVNAAVSHMLFKVGKETDSIALQADAWHLRTDVYASAGVMLGLFVVTAGERLFPGVHLEWVDPAAALVVALLILKAAWDLTRVSTRDLLDVRLPAGEEDWIRAYLSGLIPTVRGFHRMRTRKAGAHRFVEFRLFVRANMSVEEAHAITERITRDIEAHYPGSSVTVHLEPCRCTGTPDCTHECLLSEHYRATLQRPAPEKN